MQQDSRWESWQICSHWQQGRHLEADSKLLDALFSHMEARGRSARGWGGHAEVLLQKLVGIQNRELVRPGRLLCLLLPLLHDTS